MPMNRVRLLACVSLALVGCQREPGPVNSAQAIDIANEHVMEVLPQLADSLHRLDIVAHDSGAYWHVVYTPPEGSTGDPLTVDFEKATGNVRQSLRGPNYRDQVG